MRELDKRQRGVVKLCRTPVDAGEAKLDLIMQVQNFEGLSAALRSEERYSAAAPRIPVTIKIEAAKRSIYSGMQQIARRIGARVGLGYGETIESILDIVSKTENGTRRGVCLAFDHAGAVKPDTTEAVYRCADEAAYRLEIPVRVIFVMTKTPQRNRKTNQLYWDFSEGNQLLQPRRDLWLYGAKGFTLHKPGAKFIPFEGEEFTEEQEPLRKIG